MHVDTDILEGADVHDPGGGVKNASVLKTSGCFLVPAIKGVFLRVHG